LKTSLVSHYLSSLYPIVYIFFTEKQDQENGFVANGCFCHYRWETDIPTASWSCKIGTNCVSMALLLCWTDVGLMWTWVWSLWAMRHVS